MRPYMLDQPKSLTPRSLFHWRSGKTLNNGAIDHHLQEMESETKSVKDPVIVFPLQLLRAKSSLVALQAGDCSGALASCVCIALVALFQSHVKYCFINVLQKLEQRSGTNLWQFGQGSAGGQCNARSCCRFPSGAPGHPLY